MAQFPSTSLHQNAMPSQILGAYGDIFLAGSSHPVLIRPLWMDEKRLRHVPTDQHLVYLVSKLGDQPTKSGAELWTGSGIRRRSHCPNRKRVSDDAGLRSAADIAHPVRDRLKVEESRRIRGLPLRAPLARIPGPAPRFPSLAVGFEEYSSAFKNQALSSLLSSLAARC